MSIAKYNANIENNNNKVKVNSTDILCCASLGFSSWERYSIDT